MSTRDRFELLKATLTGKLASQTADTYWNQSEIDKLAAHCLSYADAALRALDSPTAQPEHDEDTCNCCADSAYERGRAEKAIAEVAHLQGLNKEWQSTNEKLHTQVDGLQTKLDEVESGLASIQDLLGVMARESNLFGVDWDHASANPKETIKRLCYAGNAARENARQAKTQRDVMAAALRKLVNEVGALEAFEPAIVEVVSFTNWRVLMQRRDEANAALATINPDDGQEGTP